MADTAQSTKMEELSEQVEELKRELSALSGTIGDMADTGKGAVGEQAERFARKGKKAMRAAMRKGKAAVNGMETTIADNPLASVAVAFGVGIVVGRLLRR